MKERRKKSKGFTLLEVIIGLVVLSIMAALLVSFMGTGVVQSANPVLLAQNGAYINQIMENMTADYKKTLSEAQSGSPLSTFKDRIGAKNSQQTTYSASGHAYTIVDNDWISLPQAGGSETTGSASDKLLKVTIDYRGLTLTALFTE